MIKKEEKKAFKIISFSVEIYVASMVWRGW